MRANPNYVLAAGVLVTFATVAAYLYAAARGLESGPILAVTGPVIAALLLQNSIARVESKADQAVENTNGALTGPLKELRDEVAKLVAQAGREYPGTDTGKG